MEPDAKRKQEKPKQRSRDFHVIIRANVIDQAEEVYTVNAVSMAEAVKTALTNFHGEYADFDDVEIEVDKL